MLNETSKLSDEEGDANAVDYNMIVKTKTTHQIFEKNIRPADIELLSGRIKPSGASFDKNVEPIVARLDLETSRTNENYLKF